ncbi:MAG: hypothetical protein AAF558_13315 [Verrucomicrobiota bacterium]
MMRARHSIGFSLVEVVLALGIAVFCIVSLLGLFTAAIDGEQESGQRVEVAHIAGRIISERAQVPSDPVGGTANPRLVLPALVPTVSGTATPASVTGQVFLDGFGAQVPATSNPEYRLDYDISYENPDPEFATLTLRFSWPASAPDNQSDTYTIVTALLLKAN